MGSFSEIWDKGGVTFENTMTATAFPLLAAPIRALFRLDESGSSLADQNDPAHTTDRLGIRCKVHDLPRHLDEAPLVPFERKDMSFHAIKMRSFPNSWTAIGSHAATVESRGFLGRMRRPRMVVVRYCEGCREAAVRWMAEREES
jgi:hypothetical protein